MAAVRYGYMLLGAAALALTGCGSDAKPHTLVFSVTGHGHVETITYAVDGRKTTVRSVDLPWKKTVRVPARDGGHTWDLKTQGANGTSTDVVYIDGKSYVVGSCSGTNCSGGSSGSIEE